MWRLVSDQADRNKFNKNDRKKQGCIEMGRDTVLATVKRFKNVLESINIRVDQLILFGSHAEGTAREDSDIDLVVISSSFSDKGYWERINILTDAIYQVLAPIEASAFTPDEWKSEKSLIFDYAKNGVSV